MGGREGDRARPPDGKKGPIEVVRCLAVGGCVMTLRSVGRSRRYAALGDYSSARAGMFGRVPGEPHKRSPRTALRVVGVRACLHHRRDRSGCPLVSLHPGASRWGSVRESVSRATCATHPQHFRAVRVLQYPDHCVFMTLKKPPDANPLGGLFLMLGPPFQLPPETLCNATRAISHSCEDPRSPEFEPELGMKKAGTRSGPASLRYSSLTGNSVTRQPATTF